MRGRQHGAFALFVLMGFFIVLALCIGKSLKEKFRLKCGPSINIRYHCFGGVVTVSVSRLSC